MAVLLRPHGRGLLPPAVSLIAALALLARAGAAAANPGVHPPDRDRDGIADATDACPEQIGLPPTGCPPRDRDGDQVVDASDACPDAPGPMAGAGCPDGDGDGDRIVDRLDRCPAEWGVPGRGGCPGPGGRAELPGIPTFGWNGVLDARTRQGLAATAAAMRAADGRRVQLTVVAEYGLSYGDSLDRARRRARALHAAVAAAMGVRPEHVELGWRGPDGNPRLVIDYR